MIKYVENLKYIESLRYRSLTYAILPPWDANLLPLS
jgi:hypothetical protein